MTAGQIIGRELTPDKPNSACAACKHIQLAGTRGVTAPINVAGTRHPLDDGNGGHVMVMLCLDAGACGRRSRRGLTPAGYGALLRNTARAAA